MRFLILLSLVGLTACMTPGEPEIQRSDLFVQSDGALNQALWARPELTSLRWEYVAALKQADIIDAQNRTQITGGGQAGVTAQDETELGAQANLTLSKVLNDSGRSDAAKAEALLQLEAMQVSYALTADQLLSTVARLLIQRDQAAKTIAIIDKNLAQYETREAQIDQAAGLGILSNAEMLNIRTALTDIRSSRLSAVAMLRSTETQLQLTMKQNASALHQAKRSFSGAHLGMTKGMPRWREVGSELSVKLSDAQLMSVLLSNKPTTSLRAQVSSPLDQNDDAQLFFGVQYNFNIFDGGQMKARAAAARATSNARHSDVETLRDQIKLAREQLRLSTEATQAQRRLLEQRRALTSQRIGELEQLLVAGRADIVTLSREILSKADTEIALVSSTAQRKSALVDYAQAVGGTCALFKVCDGLHLRLRDLNE